MFNILQMLFNPQQAVANLVMEKANCQNNPLFQRAQQMAEGKDEDQLEQTARNLCKQRGIDFDTAFAEFKRQYKL